jgi:uncharacterized membrane protein YphA (DoxX/SURF4 family)
MFVAAVVLSVVLGCMAALSGVMKLRGAPKVVEPISALGVPLGWFPFLGIAEVAGAVGLLVGLAVAPLGIAAAIGLILYFAGAELTHLRAGDIAGMARPLPLLVLSVGALVARILSA